MQAALRFFRWGGLTWGLLLFTLSVYAASPITGEWNGMAKNTPQGDTTFTMSLKQSGNTVTGSLTIGPNTIDLSEGKFKSKKLSFKITPGDQEVYEVNGTLKKNQLSGTWKNNQGATGTWTAEKGK